QGTGREDEGGSGPSRPQIEEIHRVGEKAHDRAVEQGDLPFTMEHVPNDRYGQNGSPKGFDQPGAEPAFRDETSEVAAKPGRATLAPGIVDKAEDSHSRAYEQEGHRF